nr:hypothetical protein [Ardenticatenaceae bacterium]
MFINKSRQIRQLLFTLVVSCSAVLGMIAFLSGHHAQTAAAAPQVSTCYATIDGVTVFVDTTASPVQDAVNAANENDLIKVAGTCIGVTTQNSTTQTVLITKSVTIGGGYTHTDWNAAPNPLLYPTVLDAAGGGRVVLIPDEGSFTVTLSNLQLINGVESVNSGGGVGIVGAGQNVLIRNTQIYSNTSANFGGGLRLNGARVALQNSRVYSNTSQNDGGGMSVVQGGQVTIDNSQIVSNTSGDEGGGVH